MANNSLTIMPQGVLGHVYHLEAKNWEHLVWGVPEKDQLGTLPTLVRLLLAEPVDQPITTIIFYSGLSSKGGLREGEYTKKYLLDHFEELATFPSLAPYLSTMTQEEKAQLQARLKRIITGPSLHRTSDEVREAAKDFTKYGVKTVVQIAVANHAPRCIQCQLLAREEGAIPKDQLWSAVASDTCFAGAGPGDTLIFEPPHRADDPMAKAELSPPQVLKPYLNLDRYKKQHFIARAKQILQDYDNQQL